jgi:hypothetical protein
MYRNITVRRSLSTISSKGVIVTMNEVNFTLVVSELLPHQLKALQDLIQSLGTPHVIPTSDENALLEHDAM